MFSPQNSNQSLENLSFGTQLTVDAQLTDTLSRGLAFLEALRGIPASNIHHPTVNIKAFVEPHVLQNINETGGELGLSSVQIGQFLRQQLSGGFHILRSICAFTNFTASLIYPRDIAIQRAILNLEPEEKNFLLDISKLNPVIATGTALFMGHIKDTPEIVGAHHNMAARIELFNGLIQENIQETVSRFDLAHEAYRAVFRVANNLQKCFPEKNSPGESFIEAWRTDLTRPIIEAVAHTIAEGMANLESFHSGPVTWYAPQFYMPPGKSARAEIARDWVQHSQNPHIPTALFDYLGFDTPASRHTSAIERRASVPIIGFLGRDDCMLFTTWMKNTFNAIADGLESRKPRAVSHHQGGTLVRINSNLAFIFRKEASESGQARFGILYGASDKTISLRVDKELSGLTLDFGSTSTQEMLAHLKRSCTINKKAFEAERLLLEQIASQYGNPDRDWALQRSRNTLVSENAQSISFFGEDRNSPDQKMPYLATMLVSIGQLLGTRSQLTVSHHWREQTSQIANNQRWIEDNFSDIVARLNRGIAYNRFS